VPLPFLVKGINGDSMIRVEVNALNQVYTINLPYKVKELVFDPDEWILAKYSMQFPFEETEAISIFPNPSQNLLYITTNTMDIQDWKLYDYTGKLVLEKTSSETILSGSIATINLNSLAGGVYTIQIEDKNRKTIKKIIKY
jgi:hypothetical protein